MTTIEAALLDAELALRTAIECFEAYHVGEDPRLTEEENAIARKRLEAARGALLLVHVARARAGGERL